MARKRKEIVRQPLELSRGEDKAVFEYSYGKKIGKMCSMRDFYNDYVNVLNCFEFTLTKTESKLFAELLLISNYYDNLLEKRSADPLIQPNRYSYSIYKLLDKTNKERMTRVMGCTYDSLKTHLNSLRKKGLLSPTNKINPRYKIRYGDKFTFVIELKNKDHEGNKTEEGR